MVRQRLPELVLLLVVGIFASTFVVTKAVFLELSPLAFAFARFAAITLLAFGVLAAAVRAGRAQWGVQRHHLLRFLAVGLCGYTFYQLGFVLGLDRASLAEEEAAVLRRAADEKREADDAAALERAVAMLSVLESLDEAVRSLAGQEGEEARRRIAQFEREARAMARVVELEEIATDGEIDETRHEIVDVVADSGDRDRIVDVRQRGYAFRGRVIRPAQVVVSGARVESSSARTESELTL